MDARLTLSVPEAAKVLGIATSTAWERARSGELPTIRFGGRVLVPVVGLAKLVGCEPGDVVKVLKAFEADAEPAGTHDADTEGAGR
jgi:excisionase family DNA binding protein